MAKKSTVTASSPPPRRRTGTVTVRAQWGQLEFELEAGSAPAQDPAPVPARKPRRAKVPDNLASQYGETMVTRPEPVALEPPAPRKRLTKAAREQRRELIAPDAGLLQRLHSINATTPKAVKRRPVPRGSWRFSCGRCGHHTDFAAAAALCPHCGAIALKE